MGHKQLVSDNQAADYPAFLKQLAGGDKTARRSQQPEIVRMSQPGADKALENLVKKHQVTELIDNYAEQYAELLLSQNAQLYRANYSVQVASIKDLLKEHYGDQANWRLGSWVYYPWRGQLIHVLGQPDFEALRTIRNRDLITPEEQAKLLDFKCVCFGMSVGSANALALAISGISRQIKLVDGSVISGSNLNRIQTGVESVGLAKATVVGRQIYEMNPYSDVAYFDQVNTVNATKIFDQPWPVQLAIDEIDDLEMKIRIRLEARARRLPVLMASELGDDVMLDVERFDLEPERELFHGMIPGIEELANDKLTNHREWMKHAVKILDPMNMPIKLQKSLMKIGSTIVTHPQLGSTVMITGGVLAFAVKSLALGEQLRSGRYLISLENIFLADHQTRQHQREHKKHTAVINQAINAM